MANLVSDIIKQAYNFLGVTSVTTETLSADMLADGFRILNQMWSSWSLEQTMALPWRIQGLALISDVSEYSFGPGQSWNTTTTSGATSYPLRITGWGCKSSGRFRSGGIPLSYEAFHAKVQDRSGTSAVLVQELAFHQVASLQGFTAPLMFVQVWPLPGSLPGLIDLEYIATVPDFAATSTTLNLPPGYERALAFNLAMELAPIYARVTGLPPQLEKNAVDAKLAIMSMNAAILGVNQQQAPAA